MNVFRWRWNRVFLLLAIILITSIIFFKTTYRPYQRRFLDDDEPIKVRILHSDRDRDRNRDRGVEGKKSDQKTEDLLKNQKCNIPKLDINGKEVIGFFHDSPPLKCQKKGEIEEDWLRVDENDILRFSEARKKAKCRMQYFWRKNDEENEYGEEEDVTDGKKFEKSDFAKVTCYQGLKKWTSVLWQVIRNEKAHQKARKLQKPSEDLEKKPYNVYFLGFDSLSHMSFRRKLPLTVKFLEETLGSTVLNGYNIVGDGTPQAFIPILTAQTETELPLTRKRFPEAKYLDEVYPMIWQNFSDAGYVTMYGEDMFLYNTFTYRLKGFKNPPTDHVPTVFFKEMEVRDEETCLNAEPIHNIWFRNCRKFMKTYDDVPRFLLMHQGLLSHNEINLVDVEDEDLSEHLKQMNSEGLFDDSLVIVMADHGHRFAKLRETHQGQLEERMPFFSIALPKQLRGTEKGKLMEKNIRDNKEKLTSPFDIHSSLMDILNLPTDGTNFSEMQDTSKRSLSVFRPIPSDRSCSQAGIEPHWCTCLSWQNAMETEKDVKLTRKITNLIVSAINQEMSAEKSLCAPLALSKIMEARILLPDKALLSYSNVKDFDGYEPDFSGSKKHSFAHYQIKFQTTPGNAIYEVTLFCDGARNEINLDFGAISHVNRYGDLPHCVIDRNFYIATFCVCFDKI